MTRRTGRPAIPALLTLAALLVLLSGGPAQAEPPALQVSLDASGPFADELPRSLFHGAGRLVPGDRVERTLYVRNGSDTSTDTTVQVGFDRGNELSDALDFQVGIGGAAASEAEAAGHQTFTGQLELAPGQVQPITVAMSFDRATRTQAMRQRTEVELLVTITEAMGARPGLDCREDVGVARGTRTGVTTATERPRCVPTSIWSGQPGTVLGVAALPPRHPAVVAAIAGVVGLAGAYLSLRSARRRREVAARG